MHLRWPLSPALVTPALMLLLPLAAAAQLSTVGTTFSAPSGGSPYAKTVDAEYDSTHNVFLVVTTEHKVGYVMGSFASVSGSVLSTNGASGFRIDTSGNFPFGPAIAYSSHIDAFLVVWVNNSGQIRGRFVRYGTGAVGSDFQIGSGGRASWAPAVAYSKTSQEFLVSWSTGAGPNKAVRVTTAGTVLGSPVQTTGNIWTQEPALAWNPASNEFLLTYATEISGAWRIYSQRIKDGQPVGGTLSVHSSGGTKMPDVEYSTATGKYLVTWFQYSPYGIYGRVVNADNTAAASAQPLLNSTYGSYDANSLAYNDYTDTFVVASITRWSGFDVIGGAELSSSAVPSSPMLFVQTERNHYYPEVAASSTNGRFLPVFNRSLSTFHGQMLNSGSSGGGGTPAPPPPPGSPTITSFTANRSSPSPVGVPITWTVGATGSGLEYRFFRYDVGKAAWTVGQNYSADNSYTWIPQSTGQYIVQVWVRTTGSSAAYDAWADSPTMSVTGESVTVSSVAFDATSPVSPGTAVTWTTTASGPGTLEYKYWLYNTATKTWSLARPYAPTKTHLWTATEGTYAMQVWVRRAGTGVAYEAWKNSGTITVGQGATAPVTASGITTSVPLPTKAYTAITFRIQASSSSPLEYRFWRYDFGTGTWSRMCGGYGTNNYCTWMPTAGTYRIQGWVRRQGTSAPYEAWTQTDAFVIFP